MSDDWDITHVRADLPPELWEFMKRNKFFGLNIPKEYGGLGFSALMNHKVIQKLSSISSTVSTTVGVPNSLGPAELLMHYGTDEQKQYYLPRLADGREVPCFALTGPFAGSDATSIPDYGIVGMGEWNGAQVLGIRLTLDKRYITLAPVATLIGVAFRMYDPDGLLGDTKDIGISLALVPRDTPGLEIGRRHFPLNNPFQNGPIHGDGRVRAAVAADRRRGLRRPGLADADGVPVDRALDHPALDRQRRLQGGGAASPAPTRASASSSACRSGASKASRKRSRASAARRTRSARWRRRPPRRSSRGENPAVPSTIAKYHCTEMGREVMRDAMDIHGGKGIILGPRNYLGRGWQALPISITVEGANIMTRSLMIFGQGAILCHPWVMKEMKAAQLEDPQQRIDEFDRNLFGHIGFAISNAVRAFWFGLTASTIGKAPGDDYTRRFYRKLDRYSADAGGDGRHLDAAARRQAQVQGIAVRAPGRRAQQPLHRQRDAQALRGRRPSGRRPAVAGVGVPRRGATRSNSRCPARCATSRSVRSAGCCGC